MEAEGRSLREFYLSEAKLAAMTASYYKGVEFMEKVVAEDDQLNEDERTLLVRSFTKATSSRRALLRVLVSAEEVWKGIPDDGSHFLAEAQEGKEGLASELSSFYHRVLTLLDSNLILYAVTPAEKVLYITLKGDYNRFLAEVDTGLDRTAAIAEALQAYTAAEEIARAELPPSDPNRLGLSLKFAVFHYVIQNAPEVALEIARKAYDEAIEDESAMAMASEESKKKLKMIKKKISQWDVASEEKEDGSSSEDEYECPIPDGFVPKEKIQDGDPFSETITISLVDDFILEHFGLK